MDTLFEIHSGLRWLIVLVAVMAVIWLALRWLQRKPYDQGSNILMMVFVRLLEIQTLIGIIYLIWSGIDNDLWPRERFEHLAAMLVAVFIAHLPERWKDATDLIRYRNNVVVIIVTLAIIFAGVVLLPGGTNRWDF